MKEDLNKILLQLEEDLQNLKSARDQVEKVVSSNKEFTLAANNMIVNSKVLLLKIAESSALNMDKNIAEIKAEIIRILENTELKINEISKISKESIEKSCLDSTIAIRNITSLSKSVITELQIENTKLLDQILVSQSNLDKLLKQINDLDLPKSLKSINNILIKQEKINETQFRSIKSMQTLTLIAFGALAIIMGVLKFI